MTTQPTIDQAKTEAFVGKVLADTAGLAVTVMSSIGDRLGLFKNLAEQGSATSTELAERAQINERYAREWLGAMASAGYLGYDPATRRFTLPLSIFQSWLRKAAPSSSAASRRKSSAWPDR